MCTRKSQRENKKYISFLIFVDKQYYLVYIYTYIYNSIFTIYSIAIHHQYIYICCTIIFQIYIVDFFL